MNHEERHQQMLERLEKKHEAMLERMNQQQERINERLDRQRSLMAERMEREMSRTNSQIERVMEQAQHGLSPKQEKIVDAALELLRSKGLADLSLREIAKSLHMQAPALYWHFKSKEVLIDYMAEAILKKEFTEMPQRAKDQTWQEWLTNHMLRLRRAMLAYPDGARVVAGAHPFPAVTLGKLFNSQLESLHSAGLSLAMAARIATAATTYTFGYVIEEQASPTNEELANFDFSIIQDSAPLVAELMTSQQGQRGDATSQYLSGLELIIDGATLQVEKTKQ